MKIRSMTKTLFLSVPLLAFGLAACGTTEGRPEVQNLYAFSKTAIVVNATVADVTAALSTYIQQTDDTQRGLPADWIVAGGAELESGKSPDAAALKLPDGSRIVEVCNHHYSGQAMSFGGHHGIALPCEIAVNQVGDNVEVVMLNPEAIFGLFFDDVPAEHAEGMAGLAATVRSEIEELIAESLAGFDASFPGTNVGPGWTPADLSALATTPRAIEFRVDIPTGTRSSDEDRQAFKSLVVEALMETLTHEGMESVGSKVEGLSSNDWRSARPHALKLPGGVAVVEMCSPTYAGAAMSTGSYHAPALPCQSAVWVEGDQVLVHLLDPAFIFPAFFSDVDAETMESMGEVVQAVRGDLTKIVNAALARFAG